MKKKTNPVQPRASRGISLDAQTRVICEHLSKNEDKEGKKAKAILLIADGMKQADAAHSAGLSVWQVRYLLARFRKSGIGIFKNAGELIDSSGIGERKQKRVKKEKAPPQPGTKEAIPEKDMPEDEEKEPKPKKEKKAKGKKATRKGKKRKESGKKKTKKDKKDKKAKDKKKKNKKKKDRDQGKEKGSKKKGGKNRKKAEKKKKKK